MSAALINIAGLTPIHDPAYRYKMPKLVAKVEGRGNGIKTVLVNVDDIALALKRDAPEVTKFFGTELGAQTTYTDRAIVNGAHRDGDLQNHLSRYIEHFVLCRNCHLPETHYKIKDEIIGQKCLACGHKESVDMTHKLCTFILAQYKRVKDAAKAAEKADKKKEKKEKKDKKASSGGADEEPSSTKEKKEKKEKKDKKDKKEKKEKKSSSTSANANQEPGSPKSDDDDSNDEDNGSQDDDVPTTVFSKLKVGGATSAASNDDDDEEESESEVLETAIGRFQSWLEDHANASADAQLDELRSIQIAFALRPAYRVLIYLGATFTESFVRDEQVTKILSAATPALETQKAILTALGSGSEILQRQLLAGFEWLCGVRFPALNTPVLLSKLWMQLYESELIEEDVFLLWSSDTIRNDYSVHEAIVSYEVLESVRESAKPFINWLETADGDDDEDDDDNEDEDGDDEEA